MILQPSNVELTKIHYYEKNNQNISSYTISKKVDDRNFGNKKVIIKKNVFGHRWVLQINDDDVRIKRNSKVKVLVYMLVFLSILLVVGFGIFLTLDNTVFKKKEKMVKHYVYPKDVNFRNRPKPMSINDTINEELVTDVNNDVFTKETTMVFEKKPYCTNCTLEKEICLKLNGTSKPECVQTIDEYDPTGCGGLCQINIEFCQILSRKYQVYQCSPRKTTLNCAQDQFNCGNMCINAEKRCNGFIDCSDKSDEQNCDCDYSTHFHCGNETSCVSKTHICDKRIDCWDGSDEKNCNYERACKAGEHPCDNNACIKIEQLCNGVMDCIDGSDEPEGCSTQNVTEKL
ncbi:low-density lipoprotein receptor-related protein-like [Diorhabda carinulata]|uniref:low-density lipoprotein receptor-related protein-like n=1 Tax=Diorhabda carinulata TaxID=1163345 RepID=UPI0025A187C0|nr:low-density lipoprotein receptor-related protein-like [Diorhabda carinulata]